jgi:hypothetical protein
MLRRVVLSLLLTLPLFYTHISHAQDTQENTHVFLLQDVPISVNYPDGWAVQETSNGAAFINLQEESYVAILPDIMIYFLCDTFELPDSRRAVADELVGCVLPNWAQPISEPTSIDMADQREGLLYQAENPETGEFALNLVVPYPDEQRGIERYILLFATSSIGQMTDLQNALVEMGSSLKVGDEVALETASVRTSIDVSETLLSKSIHPAALFDSHILGWGPCGQIVEVSLEGSIISTAEQDECYDVRTLYPAPDGSIWVPVRKAENSDGPIDYLLNLMPDGTRLGEIRSDELPDDLRQIAADADGKVYLLYTMTTQSQNNPGIGLEETETWIQVWSSEGEFQYQFLVGQGEYVIPQGRGALEIGPDGLLYFLDSGNNGIRVFDTAGNLIKDNIALNKVTIGNVSGFRFLPDGTMVVGVYPGSFLPIAHPAILHLDADGQLLGIFSWGALGLSSETEAANQWTNDIPIDFYMNDDGELVVLASTTGGIQVLFLTISPPQAGS